VSLVAHFKETKGCGEHDEFCLLASLGLHQPGHTVHRIVVHLKAHWRRIAVEFFGPSLMTGAFCCAYKLLDIMGDLVFGTGSLQTTEFHPFVSISLGIAVVALLPGAPYAWLMESAFVKGLQPRSGRTVARSTTLGALAGLALGMGIGLFVIRPHGEFDPKLCAVMSVVLAAYGLVVGFVLGLILRFMARRVASVAAAAGT
jgi:hypothetical protein